MKNLTTSLLILTCVVMLLACRRNEQKTSLRPPVDTIGFAQYAWQVDSILARIARLQPEKLSQAESAFDPSAILRLAISPHDDYSYVGYLYPALFQHIRSEVVVMFGVGHKARNFNLENKIVFGTYPRWKSPKGSVRVSALQNSIMKELPGDMYVVNDSMQLVEHSLEALVPFLEHYNPEVEIIPIIVPYMPFSRMEEIASSLAIAIERTMNKAKLEWGPGWSIVISTDAVHYGNEDWGGSNYDRFGVDTAGYRRAVDYEENIMNTMLAGDLTPEKIREFSSCTVQDSDYHQYKWTWCGRYAVPLGLLTAYDISVTSGAPLSGVPVGYSTSLAGEPLPVADIGMGNTAPAKLTHWVGYAAVGYK